jgi:hypothetical protein
MHRPGYAAAAAVLFLASAREARAASAIGQVAQEIARSMGSIPQGSLIVASPIASDVPMTKGDDVALRVANVLAGKLPGQARAHDRPLTPAGAHGAAKGKPAVVFLRVEIAHGELRVTADAFPVVSNAWDRVRLPPPAPIAHAFASVPIDAEIRAAMPPIPLEQATLHKAKHEEGDVLAAACGDIDGDGNVEIALVSREKVSLGHLRHGKFAVFKSQPWASIAPRVPIALREPLAGAFIARGEGLLVGTSDRKPMVLDVDLKPREPLLGIPLPGTREGCAMIDPGASAFAGPISACRGPADDRPTVAEPGVKYFDAASLAEGFVLVREPGGKLHPNDPKKTIEGAGAQIAVADLDLDGAPEIVSSVNGDPDMLAISAADGRVRLQFPAPAGIRAVCTCPPEEKGVPGVIAVVGDEVWLVR